MKIAVIGTGYVGLPTGVGFAELGYNVVCVDTDQSKIDTLSRGELYLYEDDLDGYFQRNVKNGNLNFTTDIKSAMEGAEVIIIAVGTPPHPDTQEADMQYVYAVANSIADNLNEYAVIATKSTVPVGTGDAIEEIIKEKCPEAEFDVVSLPEFLREGFAVHDFFSPDRVIVGTQSERAKKVIQILYKDFKGKTEFLYTSRRSAETIKYASNSFLAMKIHFINEMADFCEKAGAHIDEVALGMGLDTRIGARFLQPGPGYGGSCFPKDTNAMNQMSKKCGVVLNLVDTTIRENDRRQEKMADRVIDMIKDIDDPVVAILGLTFKKGTDDIRSSPAVTIIKSLLKRGQKRIKTYDPKGMENAKIVFGDSIEFMDDTVSACEGADICVICTEWSEFKNIDFANLQMRSKNILDLRNKLNGEKMRALGYNYKNIGLHKGK